MIELSASWRVRPGLSGRAVAVACLAWTLSWGGGCKKAEGPPTSGAASKGAAEQQAPAGGTAAAKSAEVLTRPEPAGPPSLKTAKEVLDSMVAVYRKATTYADRGILRIRATERGHKIDDSHDYSLVLARPNKIRLQVLEGGLDCDGRNLFASVKDLPDQVAKRPAPATMDIKTIFADRILGSAISQGPTQTFAWVPASLLLMLADDPLKTLLNRRSGEPFLLEPAKIGERECYRVQVTRPDGPAVFWIDRQSFLLRRMDFPTEELVRAAPEAKLENVSIVAEFLEAALDEQIDDKVFQFEIPATTPVVEWLLPPAYLHLGKPAPEFSFVAADGKPIRSKSLDGKVVVLDFWATWCRPCRLSLPVMEKLYKKFKDNPKVVFLAVSVDAAKTENKELKAMLDDLGVTIPYARDPEQHAGKRFNAYQIPLTSVIGTKGKIQHCELGYKPTLDAELSPKIDKLLAGQDVYHEQFADLDAEQKKYLSWLGNWAEKGIYVGPSPEEQEVPEAKIGARSEPKTFRLERLWKCTQLKAPGNLLVVPAASGPPKLLALDSAASVAEIGPNGKVLALHNLALPDSAMATLLRTAKGADGKRYYAVSGSMQQQVHLFDETWKKLLSFPQDAAKNPHAGIADVQLADLDQDGKLEMLVSYFQDVGVHGVSLEGKRIWANRTLAWVTRIAVWADDKKGREVICTNDHGSLVVLDSQGKRKREIIVPKRPIHWIVTADLRGDQEMELCGLSPAELGLAVAVGIDPTGAELWSYTLPKGEHVPPIERIVAGNLTPSGPGQWLLPGPDGSIHVIGVDGKLMDRWDTGSMITGLATMALDGQPVLVVAAPEVVEAWRVKGFGGK